MRAGSLPSLVAAFALGLAPAGAAAGGFYVPEVGARGVGLAGAMTADASSPAAVFHNPAGLLGARRAELELGGDLVLPDIVHFRSPVRDPATGETIRFGRVANRNRLSGIPFLAARLPTGGGDLGLGFGLYVPFGAALDLPADGAQRFVVTSVALRTVFAGPALAYRLGRRLSVGLGVSYVWSSLALSQRNALPFVTGDPEANPNPDPAVEGDTRIETSDPFALGWNLGVQLGAPDDLVVLGLSVLGPTALELRGQAEVHNGSIMEIDQLPAGLRRDDVRMKMQLPLVVRLGARVQPQRAWSVAFDLNWQRWSTTRDLTIDFAREHPLLLTPGATLGDVVMQNRWRDTWTARLGLQVSPFANLPLELRAGALYDQSPIDDRHFDLLTPDADKVGFGAGASYSFDFLGDSRLRADVGWLQLLFRERRVAPGPGLDPATGRPLPGSDRTILNKPAPSFFYGVTRTRVGLLSLSTTLFF